MPRTISTVLGLGFIALLIWYPFAAGCVLVSGLLVLVVALDLAERGDRKRSR